MDVSSSGWQQRSARLRDGSERRWVEREKRPGVVERRYDEHAAPDRYSALTGTCTVVHAPTMPTHVRTGRLVTFEPEALRAIKHCTQIHVGPHGDECGGWLEGFADNRGIRIVRAVDAPEVRTADSVSLKRRRSGRLDGSKVIGCYHVHPGETLTPSDADREAWDAERAWAGSWVAVIASGTTYPFERVRMAGWRIEPGRAVPLDI